MLRRPWLATLVCLIGLSFVPAVLLAPTLLGSRDLVPYDVALHPPWATTMAPTELDALRAEAFRGADDVVLSFVPELRFARDEISAGRLPWWNPHARFGAPLASTTVTGLLYPLNAVLLAFDDPQRGLGVVAWISLSLAAGLMFSFLRALGMGRHAAVFGSLAFALSGTAVANAYYYQRLAAWIWLPGVLWGVHTVARARSAWGTRWGVLGLGVSGALSIVAGFPYFAVLNVAVGAAYALALSIAAARCGRPRSFTTLGMCVAGGILAVGLAAYAWWPMAEFFSDYAHRQPETDASLAAHGFPLAGYLGWFAPRLFCDPLDPGLDPARSIVNYWLLARSAWDGSDVFDPIWSTVENTVFVGTWTLPLAWFAVLRPRRPFEFALGIVAVVLVVLSLGHPVLGGVHAAPGMHSIMPSRFSAPLAGVLAVLAASGLDRLSTDPGRRRRLVTFVLLVASSSAAAIGWMVVHGMSAEDLVARLLPSVYERFAPFRPGLGYEDAVEHVRGPGGVVAEATRDALERSLAGAAVTLGLGAAWWFAACRARRDFLWRSVAVLALATELMVYAAPLLRGTAAHARPETEIHAFFREHPAQRSPTSGGFAAARATGADSKVLPLAFPPGQLGAVGVRDVQAYTFLDGYSHRVFETLYGADHMIRGDAWPYAFPDDERLGHPLLDLFGVRWLISEERLENAGEPVARIGPAGAHERGLFVHERPGAMPRAFTVPALTVVADDDEVLRAMAAGDAEIHARTAWVTADEKPSVGPIRAASDRDVPSRGVVFERDVPGEVTVSVEEGVAGWLVLNDAWSEGWSAALEDGATAPTKRVNLSMMAVGIPSAACRVTFRYAPPGLRAGIAWTLVSLGCLLSILIVPRRRSNADTARV